MSVGPSHPRCFVVGGALWVVPSGTGHDVATTRRSRAGTGAADGARPALVDAWTSTGGVTGGFFMGTVAGAVWHVEGLGDLAAFVLSGALVGAVLAVGTKRLFADFSDPRPDVARPDGPDRDLPAVRVPWDVANAAPDDADGDELALWSLRAERWRLARAAREARELRVDPDVDGGGAEAEAEYREAAADYEPVARLLGLPLPLPL
ncbi:hypothetical protein IFT90_07605 [Frigoribacterium sp. CFBP 8766]|uniref:hypothetical protein n=1 Tax=Frigoribacterium sp. CFBP 8766 TaxID=2775273 RepID=UPI0017875E15|nr:hypothetical protein [Frigoribacterium sp. CFBP 8766]MBD8584422.1 hypothetical protein [Frigoribacterium sp. CFBP 8766]